MKNSTAKQEITLDVLALRAKSKQKGTEHWNFSSSAQARPKKPATVSNLQFFLISHQYFFRTNFIRYGRSFQFMLSTYCQNWRRPTENPNQEHYPQWIAKCPITSETIIEYKIRWRQTIMGTNSMSAIQSRPHDWKRTREIYSCVIELDEINPRPSISLSKSCTLYCNVQHMLNWSVCCGRHTRQNPNFALMRQQQLP